MTATPRSVHFRVEIGSLPRRDRFTSASRSVRGVGLTPAGPLGGWFRGWVRCRSGEWSSRAALRRSRSWSQGATCSRGLAGRGTQIVLVAAHLRVFPRSRGARAASGRPQPGLHRPSGTPGPTSTGTAPHPLESIIWMSDSRGGVASDARSAGLSPGCSASRSPGAVPGSLAEIGPRRWPEIGLFRPEAGLVRRSGGPLGAAVPREVIIPRTFSFPRRPARTAEPRNHADSHGVRGCWPA